MKTISRDISLTLMIKLLMLFILWYVCFKGMHKPVNDVSRWLLGSNSGTQVAGNDKSSSQLINKSKVNPSKKGDL